MVIFPKGASSSLGRSRARVASQFMGASSSTRFLGQLGRTRHRSRRYSSESRPAWRAEAMSDSHVQATSAASSEPRCIQFLRLCVPAHNRKNWLFTWLDLGGERTAHILSITATAIVHDVDPRAYLHLVTKLIVQGWPNAKLRDLLPDRMLVRHPELFVGDRDALDLPALDA